MSIIAANTIRSSRLTFDRITINIRGGNVIDRLSAASKLLGYTHTHRDLMIGRPPVDASTDIDAEVVWGRSAHMLTLVDIEGGAYVPVEVAITVLDTKRSQRAIPGSERVFVYGDRIMHKKCDTTCPEYALQSIIGSHGYVFIDWMPAACKGECE